MSKKLSQMIKEELGSLLSEMPKSQIRETFGQDEVYNFLVHPDRRRTGDSARD